MNAFESHEGTVMPLPRANVDTDQIVPKQFLKRIERSGFGEFLFWDWRKDPAFVLNQPQHRGASILVAGANFGCGSSREHAPWALEDHGFRVVIAPSFGDIFRTNCGKIGLLAVTLPEDEVRMLLELGERQPGAEVVVDLVDQVVRGPGFEFPFTIDEFTRQCLLNGWDDVGLVARHQADIEAYEARRPDWMPKLTPIG